MTTTLRMHSRHTTSGFTLIELLVVIAIIGLLAAVILAQMNQARIRARDTARIQEVRELKKAMEYYFDDNKTYVPAGLAPLTVVMDNATFVSGLTGGTTKYISSIPQILIDGDGVGNKDRYSYSTYPAYAFMVYLEGSNTWCITGANDLPSQANLFSAQRSSYQECSF